MSEIPVVEHPEPATGSGVTYSDEIDAARSEVAAWFVQLQELAAQMVESVTVLADTMTTLANSERSESGEAN